MRVGGVGVGRGRMPQSADVILHGKFDATLGWRGQDVQAKVGENVDIACPACIAT